MAPRPSSDAVKLLTAGDRVEVIDRTSRFYGKIGIIAFFVADNVYVKFPPLRWSSRTRMFFAEQLRPADPIT